MKKKKNVTEMSFCNVTLRRWTLYKNESQITRNAGSIINFQGASLTSYKVTHMWIIVSIDILLTVSLEETVEDKLYPSQYLLVQVNNGNAITMCEVCSKLTVKTPERRDWCCSGVFVVNFEQSSQIVLVFPLLTLNN